MQDVLPQELLLGSTVPAGQSTHWALFWSMYWPSGHGMQLKHQFWTFLRTMVYLQAVLTTCVHEINLVKLVLQRTLELIVSMHAIIILGDGGWGWHEKVVGSYIGCMCKRERLCV